MNETTKPDRYTTLDRVHSYKIGPRPAVLHIGVPEGRMRPAMWLSLGGERVLLAQFHGEAHALAVIAFLDTMMFTVNEAIDFHNTVNVFNASAPPPAPPLPTEKPNAET